MPPPRVLDIRWSTDDPDAITTRLQGYGFAIESGRVVALRSAIIGIDAGTGPADRLEIADGAAAHPAALRPHPNGIEDVVAIGWATVDRERFLAGQAVGATEELPRDPHLGAFAIRHGSAGPGPQVLVLEPDTEGRLAAALVRSGEGPAAIYFAAGRLEAFAADARRRGMPVSSVRLGPLGPSVVLLGGPMWGPHLIVVDRPSGGTIAT